VEVRYIHRVHLEPLLVSRSGAIVRAGGLTAAILVPTLADFRCADARIFAHVFADGSHICDDECLVRIFGDFANFLAVNRAAMDALIALHAGAAIPARKVKSKRLLGFTDSLELVLENDEATARNLFCDLLGALNCSLMRINCDLISLKSKAENGRKE
jgi:hypothetical protein